MGVGGGAISQHFRPFLLTRNTFYISHRVQFSVGPYGKVSLRISMMTAPSPERPLIRMRPLSPDETLKKTKKNNKKKCVLLFLPRAEPPASLDVQPSGRQHIYYV